MVKTIAAISLLYDVGVGVLLSAFRGGLQSLFDLPAPQPPIHADLNAIFVICVGIGYLLPYRDPERYRGYLWIFGVALKSAGAIAFLADYIVRGSPAAFLLFAASDGLLAALTLVALLRTRTGQPGAPPDRTMHRNTESRNS